MMTTLFSLHFFYVFLKFSTFFSMSLSYAAEQARQVYVVYMGGIQHDNEHAISSYHLDMLQQVMQSSFASESLVRSYNRSFNAFAANLTNTEREKLASFEEVVSIFPSRTLQTQTTRSWDFMGFPEDVDRKPASESDIIIGVIDTGVWPESESFNDRGYGPPPKKWRGVCRGGKNFSCNKKLVGARFYGSESDSARDEYGHGSHVASTAAGRAVRKRSFYGLGCGTARGGAPSARIAVYKACSPLCPDTDILAAFDDAIADGVDIISISISLGDPVDVKYDGIAIAAFHAAQKGILTVHAAGNNGPTRGAITSVAPWLFSVGATTIDRVFFDRIELGNGHVVVTGGAIDTSKRKRVKRPLVYGKDVSRNCSELNSKKCAEGCLDKTLVKNKIVVCDELADSTEAFLAGAAGIIKKTPSKYPPFVVPFPESRLTRHAFTSILNYINSTKRAGTTPKAYISATKTRYDRSAPRVAGFSARGPNSIIPNILKPDVTAPGMTILAAFSPATTPSLLVDKRAVNYSILSGTSMACPHVSGAAAYVKSFRPNWSPAAVKSALMTTAWSLKNRKTGDVEFAYGAGHIDPVRATSPGLVYDTSIDDYVKLLCNLGYNTTTLRRITGNNESSCPKPDSIGSKHHDLNYPSMAAKVETNRSFVVKFLRRVTNVGRAKSIYRAKIIKDSDIDVVVKPRILRFKALNERKSFGVRAKGKISGMKNIAASLEWSDGIHRVASPIVVYDDSAF